MPSVSKKQHNFMAMVANDPKKAKQLGIKQSVGEEFLQADKGKKFAKGGETMDKKELAEDKKLIKKAIGMHDKQEHAGKKTDLSKLKKGGKCYKKGGAVIDGIAKRGKTKGTMVKMCGGGKTKGK